MTTGNLLDVLILFGSIQGFISSFILLSRKQHVANRILATILIFISMACLNIYLFMVLPHKVPTIIFLLEKVIPLIIIMPLGPLIYFFIRSSSGDTFRFKENRLHFLPTLLDVVPSIVSIVGIILYALGVQETIDTAEMVGFKGAYEKYVDIPRWVSTSIYLTVSFKYIRFIQIPSKRKRNLKQFIIGFGIFQLLWLFHLIPYLLPGSSQWLLGTLSWYPVYVPLTILVYWLGITALVQVKGNAYLPKNRKELEETISSINQVMKNEALYLNPSFSLNELVATTGIDQKTISAALNQHLGKSLNEYVNELRVEEVQKKMLDQSFSHLSITGIALESGFNSQATFQRAFKSVTGMTPKAWRSSTQN